MKILRAILPLGNRKGWKQLKVRGQKKLYSAILQSINFYWVAFYNTLRMQAQ